MAPFDWFVRCASSMSASSRLGATGERVPRQRPRFLRTGDRRRLGMMLLLAEPLEGDRGQGGEVRLFTGVHDAPASPRALRYPLKPSRMPEVMPNRVRSAAFRYVCVRRAK